jgi:hypothetical protein
MEKKRDRISCKLCARRVANQWGSKFRHVLKHHPEMILTNMGYFMGNPAAASEAGARLAQMFKSRMRW